MLNLLFLGQKWVKIFCIYGKELPYSYLVTEDIISKLEKNWPIFSSFNRFPSSPSLAANNKLHVQHYFLVFIDTKTSFSVLQCD